MAKAKSGDTPWDHFWDWYGSLDGRLQTFILLATVVTIVVSFLKWAKPLEHYRAVKSDLRAFRDTFAGRPAMRDSITGRIIPGTARRSIGERVDDMAESVKMLVEKNQRLDDHEKRIERIEDALHIDRRLDKIEGIQLLRTIETAVQSEPSAERPEGERPD
jgi:hypothetical protein